MGKTRKANSRPARTKQRTTTVSRKRDELATFEVKPMAQPRKIHTMMDKTVKAEVSKIAHRMGVTQQVVVHNLLLKGLESTRASHG